MSRNAKPAIQLRRPQQPPSPAHVERFVHGTEDEPARPAATPTLVPAPSQRRRTTIYFEPNTFRDLKHRCAQEDAELSAFVDRAVRAYLAAQPNV
jgi:hypothetical protein